MQQSIFWILVFLLLQLTNSILMDWDEYLSLWEFYNKTNGLYWTYDKTGNKKNYLPWKFDNYYVNNPCKNGIWYGLLCATFADFNGREKLLFWDMNGIGNVTGTPPSVIGNFSILIYLMLNQQNLEGSLPKFVNMPNLNILNVSHNNFQGSITNDHFQNLTSLQLLYLSSNRLTGSIPDILYEMKNMTFLSFINNSFDGTIKSDAGNWKQLVSFNIGNNEFHGTIPPEIASLPSLQFLLLEDNKFTGTIPPIKSPHLVALRTSCNSLSGPFPMGVCDSKNITVISLYDNKLHGTLPVCLSSLKHLNVLQLQENRFVGQIHGIVNPNLQAQLTYVDISDNAFTGSFPGEIFLLPNLYSIAAAKNCFQGRLPNAELCQSSRSLHVLSLDGLHSSPYCSSRVWDPFHLMSGGYVAKLMEGSIPDCIWSFPNISVIHIAGNGFSGTLPQNIHLPKSLQSVALTHNELNGTIGKNFQYFPFLKLDLSYNKLTGDINEFGQNPLLLESSFDGKRPSAAMSSELILQVNRLSGDLPTCLEEISEINILSGNMFSCKSRSDLPSNDAASRTYICGSDDLNNAIYVLIVLLSVLLVGYLAVVSIRGWTQSFQKKTSVFKSSIWYYLQKVKLCWIYTRTYCSIIEKSLTQRSTFRSSTLSSSFSLPKSFNMDFFEENLLKYENVFQYLAVFNLLRKMSMIIAAFTIAICLPTYLGFYLSSNGQYSTFTYHYSWVSTSVFLTGASPALVLFTLWNSLLIYCLVRIIFHYNMHTLFQRTKLSKIIHRASISTMRFSEKLRESLTTSSARKSSYAGIRSSFKINNTPIQSQEISNPINQMLASSALLDEDNIDNRDSHIDDEVFHPDDVDVDVEVVATPPLTKQAKNTGHNMLPRISDLSLFEFRRTLSTNTAPNTNRDTFSLMSLRIQDMDDLIRYENIRQKFQYYFLLILIFIFNLTASLCMNAAYIIMQNASNISPESKFGLQVFMATFKIGWNLGPIRWMMNMLPKRKGSTKLHVTMLLTNTVLAPCLATAVTQNTCFSDLFFGSDAISSSYALDVCVDIYQSFDVTYVSSCTDYRTVQYVTEFSPSFIYYYGCGAKLLTAYIPVFIYSYTILLVLAPCVYCFLACIETQRSSSSKDPQQRRSLFSVPPSLIRLIDGVLRPQDQYHSHQQQERSRDEGDSETATHPAGMIDFVFLIRGNATLAMIIQHIVVLLTFGIASPVLAVVMTASISVNCLVWQLIIIRYIKYHNPKTPFSPHFMKSNHGKKSTGSDEKSVTEDHLQLLENSSVDDGLDPHQQQQQRQYNETAYDPMSSYTDHMNNPFEILFGKRSAVDQSTFLTAGDPSIINSNNNKEQRSSNNSNNLSFLPSSTATAEELCLFELHTILDRSWFSVRDAMWLIFYWSCIFYGAMLFDVAADEKGWLASMWIVVGVLTELLSVRFLLLDTIIGLLAWFTGKRHFTGSFSSGSHDDSFNFVSPRSSQYQDI
jgi:hypothetical protein